MQLLNLIKNKYNIISGVARIKTSGKTVTLDDNVRFRITSLEKGEEKQDLVNFTENLLFI